MPRSAEHLLKADEKPHAGAVNKRDFTDIQQTVAIHTDEFREVDFIGSNCRKIQPFPNPDALEIRLVGWTCIRHLFSDIPSSDRSLGSLPTDPQFQLPPLQKNVPAKDPQISHVAPKQSAG